MAQRMSVLMVLLSKHLLLGNHGPSMLAVISLFVLSKRFTTFVTLANLLALGYT
jgi:hypothetical protein